MTGIERLREMAETDMANGYASESRVLSNIADQIEREAEAPFSRMRVLAVVTDMERHVIGVEGMEDSPVARWARELREALGGRDEEVTDVATIRKDAYDAYEWVEAHDGLDAVKHRWECLSYYVDPVPRACMERRLASRQRQIDESHAALRRRNERIVELEHERDELREMVRSLNALTDEMEKRLMPEGMCWHVYEDGEPVRCGDEAPFGAGGTMTVNGVELTGGGHFIIHGRAGGIDRPCQTGYQYGQRVKRPAKVLDADGVEIRARDHVWHMETGQEYVVVSICYEDGVVVIQAGDKTSEHEQYAPSLLTHRAPVLAADGKPLREGETVYHTKSWMDKEPRVIERLEPLGDEARVWFSNGSYEWSGSLTHERPDSWERLWMDMHPADETECVGLNLEEFERRAKALAERGL